LSSFDEGEAPAGTRRSRPRRPAGADDEPPDQRTLYVRRAIALGVGVLVFILLVVLVRGCLSSRADRALRDYNRDVTGIASESRETTAAFFDVLGQQGAGRAVDQEAELNQLRVQAEREVRRARGFDVPGDMQPAHRTLLLALDFRAESIAKVARNLTAAKEGEDPTAEQATARIAGQMQALLASDVIYVQRVAPFIRQALSDNEISGQTVYDEKVVVDGGWLNARTVASRIGGQSGGGSGSGGSSSSGDPAPGLHGHGLTSVAVGETRLQPSPAPNRVPAAASVAFDVAFANQGDNPEEGVRVRVRVQPAGGGRAIAVNRTVDQTRAGAEASVSVPLGQAPPAGAATVTVEIVRVPGEEKVDNNRQQYAVNFTR